MTNVTFVIVFNLYCCSVSVCKGDRIAQLILERIFIPELVEMKVLVPQSVIYLDVVSISVPHSLICWCKNPVTDTIPLISVYFLHLLLLPARCYANAGLCDSDVSVCLSVTRRYCA